MVCLQGLFLKRQQEAAEVIAENSHRFFLRQPLLWNEILHGTYRDRWEAMLRRVTERFVRERGSRGVAERLAMAALVGEENLQRIVQLVRRPAVACTSLPWPMRLCVYTPADAPPPHRCSCMWLQPAAAAVPHGVLALWLPHRPSPWTTRSMHRARR